MTATTSRTSPATWTASALMRLRTTCSTLMHTRWPMLTTLPHTHATLARSMISDTLIHVWTTAFCPLTNAAAPFTATMVAYPAIHVLRSRTRSRTLLAIADVLPGPPCGLAGAGAGVSTVLPHVSPIFPSVSDVFASVADIFAAVPRIFNSISAQQTVWTNTGPAGCAGRIFPVGSLTTARPGRIPIRIRSLGPIRMVLHEALVGFRVVLLETLQGGLALRLPVRRHLFVLRRIRGLQFLQSFMDTLPPLLKRLTKGFGILLLQSLQALLSALPKLIGDPGIGLRVGLLQMRQALLELGLALLDGLLKRFGVVLLELSKPLNFLADPFAPSRLAVARFLRHGFLRCLFFLCQNPARNRPPHREHKTQQKSLHGSSLLFYPIRRHPVEKVYTN